MKMAANETELRNALKEKTQEITIVTSYADKVMNRYNAELTTKINYSMIAMLPPLKLGLAHYLKFSIHSDKFPIVHLLLPSGL